jgi:hypothetical protein
LHAKPLSTRSTVLRSCKIQAYEATSLSAYIDPRLMAQLNELAYQKAQSKSLVAEAAIASFLTPDDPDRREAALGGD